MGNPEKGEGLLVVRQRSTITAGFYLYLSPYPLVSDSGVGFLYFFKPIYQQLPIVEPLSLADVYREGHGLAAMAGRLGHQYDTAKGPEDSPSHRR